MGELHRREQEEQTSFGKRRSGQGIRVFPRELPRPGEAVETLEKPVSPLAIRPVITNTIPHQLASSRHPVETHKLRSLGSLMHHRCGDHSINLRRGVFHGKTRVSISVRLAAADHVRQ